MSVQGAYTYWRLLILIRLCSTVGSFKVTVPVSPLVAVRGHPVVLGCEFTSENSIDLTSLVITWQRKEDTRVVHSFYYQQDQLKRQSADYQNRTSLFKTELEKGNASLRIVEVGPRDVGWYQCLVSSSSGTDRAELQLNYGAYYTEPRLSISFSTTTVTMQYEAEGFPKPEVMWMGDQGQNLSHHTEFSEGVEEEVGLYNLKSSYVASNPVQNITFVLKNQLLSQNLQRPISFNYADHSSYGAVIALALICVVLLLVVLLLIWLYLHKKK